MRVLIADDHGIVRKGLGLLLQTAGLEVVASVADGQAAVEQACRLRPDIALLDIRMPALDGLTALRRIKACAPEVIVIMLTTYASLEYLSDAILAGAAGYITKDMEPERIPEVLQRAAAGENVLDDQMLQMALQSAAEDLDASAPVHAALTDQETRILALIARGLSNQQIAETLVISRNTVKTHMRHIFDKLNVSDRTQAAIWAVRHGL